MAKRVYFAFHYQDVIDFRANVVRNHWVCKSDREDAGFFDGSLWERAKKINPTVVKGLINGGLNGTSVTCVLIGSHTFVRPWVRYEIMKSFKKGNRIFGVHINYIPCKNRMTKLQGPNPFEYLGFRYSLSGETVTLLEHRNGAWKEYEEVDEGASYRLDNPAPQQHRGKAYNLSQLFPVYDWVTGDGYNKFSDWVG